MKTLMAAALMCLGVNAFAEDRIMTLKHLENSSSYFQINIQDEGLLKGSYPGWCADWARQIEDDIPYNIKFYSSYNDNIPAGIVDRPENLKQVNWIANQNFAGKTAPGDLGVYTAGDVQLAIWTLIDDSFQTSTVGPFSQARVDHIVAQANQHGANFYPTCKQEVVIVIDSGTPQSTLIEVKIKRFPKCAVPIEG